MSTVAECDSNELNQLEEEESWLRTSTDCPYFDDMPTGIVNNKNKKRKANYSNRGGNKKFKKGKNKK